jgi:hypothetical protein
MTLRFLKCPEVPVSYEEALIPKKKIQIRSKHSRVDPCASAKLICFYIGFLTAGALSLWTTAFVHKLNDDGSVSVKLEGLY